MNYFLRDIYKNKTTQWDELIHDLNDTTKYNPYCKTDDLYEVFRHIIYSMLAGKEVILLDSDFSKEELRNLTGNIQYDNFDEMTESLQIRINNKDDLIKKLSYTSNNWKITLFTSGTTGVPKQVTHNFQSISRFVKYSAKTTGNVWGFAYNPTHMAGVQVFLQAILNGNSIVRLFGCTPAEILSEIKNHGITHVSATPTFYRLLLPVKDIFPSVIRITFGGEKFAGKTAEQLQKLFPNATITNIYATTEAGTLFASRNDIFTTKPGYEQKVRIIDNELLIHESMTGITNIDSDGWYHTGDIVEIVSNNPLSFRFVNRKSEMINTGGYKVNPLEVEDAIRSFSGIRDVRVFPKKNSVLGNIICCEIAVIDNRINESDIRKYLQTKLQEFKIPRVIKFTNELPTTRTGKIKREQL